MAKTTKPKSATTYKETAFGILPRSKVVELEKEGITTIRQVHPYEEVALDIYPLLAEKDL